MAMIARQADRLNAIVEDLLTLARIEQGEGREAIELRRGLLQPVLKAATETCSAKAAEKQIRLDVSMQEASQARINPPLLEQAVVNLLDNAIKYSPIGSSARLTVSQADGEITIEVSDDGPGIAAEHLPRLFERFYRTDKARSREVGGTGLGLSIVKHVAQAHGGHVTVDSAPGRGSRFRIHLPAS